MFARLLRRNFLFAEPHSAHHIRSPVRYLVPGFDAVLGCYLALGLLPSAGSFSGLRLSGRSGLAVRLGLRSRLSVCFGPGLQRAAAIDLFIAPQRSRVRESVQIDWGGTWGGLIVGQHAVAEEGERNNNGYDFHPVSCGFWSIARASTG